MLLKDSTILVVDDDEDVLIALRLLLKSRVKELTVCKNPNQILTLMSKTRYDLVILDMNFDGLVNTGNEGIFWLNKIKKEHADTQVMLITAYADIDLAIKSLKRGAADFMVKPWKNDKLIESLTELLSARSINKQVKAGKATAGNKMVGNSAAMESVFTKIEKLGPTEANILILGENGTGKELVAEALHASSNRKSGPFVKVDVGSLTESLFESELFGYKKGAFTDAREDRKGRFEAANGGTLFLDEIGNITLRQQARLLSVLQNRVVIPLGSNQPVPIDVRLICATNLTIRDLADEKRFRKDLMYRINTVDITLPPLRNRGNDVIVLAQHFADQYADQYGKSEISISKDAESKLEKHTFPGNVRELQHVMERAVIMAGGERLMPDDIQFSNLETMPESLPEQREVNLEKLERNTILSVIERNDGNITKSAKELGLTRTALYRRLNKYDL
jgi:DNA-binding NtrC family response regulator